MVKDLYIFKDNDNLFAVMGIYKGIRILLKVFDNELSAKEYIKKGIF